MRLRWLGFGVEPLALDLRLGGLGRILQLAASEHPAVTAGIAAAAAATDPLSATRTLLALHHVVALMLHAVGEAPLAEPDPAVLRARALHRAALSRPAVAGRHRPRAGRSPHHLHERFSPRSAARRRPMPCACACATPRRCCWAATCRCRRSPAAVATPTPSTSPASSAAAAASAPANCAAATAEHRRGARRPRPTGPRAPPPARLNSPVQPTLAHVISPPTCPVTPPAQRSAAVPPAAASGAAGPSAW